MKHKRMLIVAGNFYPSTLGGPSRSLYWLATALARNNVSVSVVTTNCHIEKGAVIEDKWNDVGELTVYYATSMSALLKQSRISIAEHDVVLLSSVCYKPSSVVAFLSALRGKEIIWAPRGELHASAIEGSAVKKLYFSLLKLLFGRKVLWQATSEEEKALIQHYFGVKAHIALLPNYMSMPMRVQRSVGESYFVYVGRIAPIKALDNVVNGFALSECFRSSQYKFYIVGGVESQFETYGKELRRLIGELGLDNRVVFKGALYGVAKDQVYANAYMSILLSNSENFGNVVIESLSQGTPVIASQGTPWQVLNEMKAGYWVDNSPQTIADTIDKVLMLSKNTYGDYRVNAIKLADTFDIDKNVGKWIQILDEC